jgi:PBP1b-binding outer membrane lipoprotein LpoB
MRIAIGLLGTALLLAGCMHHKPASHPAPPVSSPQPKPVIKPDLRTAGHVAMVNTEGRFVVINFPSGAMPATGQRLNIYHNGLKTGEVTVTGPQRENDTVADITAGEVQLHDEVRME